MNHFSIYVSNLHKHSSQANVTNLFSIYGEIIFIKLYKNKKGLCRGFANITFQNKSSYDKALQAEIYFKGKKVKVEPYLSNSSELEAKDRKLKKLRICVLNIPKYFRNKDFEELFTANFGPISSAYIKESSAQETNLGFVTFVRESQCQRALLTKYLKINQQDVLMIRKFTGKKTHHINYGQIYNNYRKGSDSLHQPKFPREVEPSSLIFSEMSGKNSKQSNKSSNQFSQYKTLENQENELLKSLHHTDTRPVNPNDQNNVEKKPHDGHHLEYNNNLGYSNSWSIIRKQPFNLYNYHSTSIVNNNIINLTHECNKGHLVENTCLLPGREKGASPKYQCQFQKKEPFPHTNLSNYLLLTRNCSPSEVSMSGAISKISNSYLNHNDYNIRINKGKGRKESQIMLLRNGVGKLPEPSQNAWE